MSVNTHPATKYRVAIRAIAIDNGWAFEEVDGRTDRFTKDATKVDVHHGPSNLISFAEVATPKGLDTIRGGGKMFEVQAVLTGIEDPRHERYIRLTPEQAAKFESGQGIAKIGPAGAVTVVRSTAPAAEPKAKPAPRGKKSAPVAKATPAKPAPRAAKPAPAVTA